jgi:hypothetical protein
MLVVVISSALVWFIEAWQKASEYSEALKLLFCTDFSSETCSVKSYFGFITIFLLTKKGGNVR